MKKSRFNEEQIIGILREGGGKSPVKAVCAKHNVSEGDLLHLEEEVWRDGRGGGATGCGHLEEENRTAQAAGSRPGGAAPNPQGDQRKKMVSPSTKTAGGQSEWLKKAWGARRSDVSGLGAGKVEHVLPCGPAEPWFFEPKACAKPDPGTLSQQASTLWLPPNHGVAAARWFCRLMPSGCSGFAVSGSPPGEQKATSDETARGHLDFAVRQRAARTNEVWSWDFVDRSNRERHAHFRMLTLIDEHTRRCAWRYARRLVDPGRRCHHHRGGRLWALRQARSTCAATTDRSSSPTRSRTGSRPHAQIKTHLHSSPGSSLGERPHRELPRQAARGVSQPRDLRQPARSADHP